MKKIISIVLVTVMAAALAVSLSACGISNVYEHADRYSVGNAKLTDRIDSLDLNWEDGRVDIVYHDSPEILLSETGSSSLSDEIRLHWWVDGTTLRIHFAASGQVITGRLNKALTVTLPSGLEFSSLKLDVTGGDVQIRKTVADYADLQTTSGSITADLNVKNADIGSTSGDLSVTVSAQDRVKLHTTSGKISGTVQAKEILTHSTSGKVSLKQQETSEKIEMDTTSGDIELNCAETGTLKAGSTSGRITVCAGKMQKADIDTTSGGISFTAYTTPGRMKIGSTSGDVSIRLPENASFTANVDQTSGDFFYEDIALKKQGDRYVAGDGSASFDIDSTSGDIRLGIAR